MEFYMPFKICIIGCGGISSSCHAPSYIKYRIENPGVELAACCDLDSEKAAGYGKQFGFSRHYTEFKEMLNKEKPDAVCVTVDEDHNANVGIEVMNMGFPMFIEKPPGKDSRETRLLINAAKQNGVINQVGYNRRFLPIFQELKRMMAATIGDGNNEPQFIRYDFYRVARFDEDFSDTAVHGIDAVRYIAGSDYKKVRFTYQPLPKYGAGVKNIYMDCIMESGLHAQLSFCPVTGLVVERATVHAEGNTWMANTPIWAEGYDRPGEVVHVRKSETVARVSGADLCGSSEVYITNGFYNENKEFFDNVRAGRQCACDLASALNTSLIKDCITGMSDSFEGDTGP